MHFSLVTKRILEILLLLAISFTSIRRSLSQESEEFCYNKPSCGPSTWGGSCQVNTGRQSPINIDLRNYPPMGQVKSINLSPLYKQAQSTFYIQKTNTTIRIDLLKKNPGIYFTSEGLTGQYIFDQLHFHWGLSVYGSGSEHSINDEFIPMELHLVHYSSRFTSFDEALNSGQSDALAVIAVFLTVRNNGDNPYLSSVIAGIPRADPNGSKTQVAGQINLANLFRAPNNPYAVGAFSRYPGSLTTPPCAETVIFTVLIEPNLISYNQLRAFQTARSKSGEAIGNNFRPIQALGNRRIETSLFRLL